MQTLRLVASPTVDEDAIKAMAARDPNAAADALVRTWREALFHHAAWILKDYEEAIDVVQEVFIKALREPRLFDEEFRIKAWLYRVTSNLCFNLVRDRRRRTAILDTLPKKSATDDTQFDAIAEDEQQQRILEAFDQVSEAHREILALRYYSDLSYAEIAEVLDIKLGTVMSRLSRAKSALVEVLDGLGVEEA
jgi:RNA polymerase sigma-70 factor (ECF subfamily)